MKQENYIPDGDRTRELARMFPEKFAGHDIEALVRLADEQTAERKRQKKKFLEPEN